MLKGIGPVNARNLVAYCGGVDAIFTDIKLKNTLAKVPGIVGIKDATGDIGRGTELLKRVPKDFAVYSGDDASELALMLLGRSVQKRMDQR